MNKKKSCEIFIFLILFFLFFIPMNVCLSSENTIIYVGGENVDSYSSIQDAINNAQQNDIIHVSKGIYNEKIRLHKTVHLQGEDKTSTIIEYQDEGDIVSITADGCSFKGFTVRNSKGKGYSGINIESNNNTIIDNIIENNSNWGVYLYYSSNNFIEDNIFVKDGVNIVGNFSSWNTHVIRNNTVNDKKLLFYKDMDNVTISTVEAGQIILSNCTNFLIRDLTILNTDQGITLGYCVNCSIINNSVYNSIFGIRLNYASNNTIAKNSIERNDYGIYIIHSNYNIVFDNLIYSNKMFGCWICCKSYFNTLYLNNFTSNNKSAYDTFDNQWYKNKSGNYWDDYNGTDKDRNGRGDVPYYGILPNGESIDMYPLGFFIIENNVDNTNGFGIVLVLLSLIFILIMRKTNNKKK